MNYMHVTILYMRSFLKGNEASLFYVFSFVMPLPVLDDNPLSCFLLFVFNFIELFFLFLHCSWFFIHSLALPTTTCTSQFQSQLCLAGIKGSTLNACTQFVASLRSFIMNIFLRITEHCTYLTWRGTPLRSALFITQVWRVVLRKGG